MPRIKSLGTLLIVSLSLVVALGVTGILLYVTNSTYQLTLNEQEQALQHAGDATKRGLDAYCRDADTLCGVLATDPLVAASLTSEAPQAQARLTAAIKADPNVWSLLVFNASGVITAGINNEGKSLVGQNRADRDYFKAIMGGQDKYVCREIIVAKTGGDDGYIFSSVRAVKNAAGKTVGGIGVYTKWGAFTDSFIKPLRFGTRGYAYMLDEKGRVVAHGGDPALMLKDVSGDDFVKKALTMKSGEFFYDWKGERKFMTFATDPGTGFLICNSAYESDLTAAAITQRNIMIAIGVAVLILLGLGIAFLVRRLAIRPMEHLGAYAKAVAAGDYTAKRETDYRYEMAELATNLHNMVDQLKQRLGFAQGVLTGVVLPCAVFDPDNKATYVNQKMLDTLERLGDPKDYLGKTSGGLFYDEPDRDTLSFRAMRENRMLKIETEYVTASGKHKIFDITSTPFNDMDGNVIGTLAIWFELTEIRLQQKRIQEQTERIAKAAAAANAVSDQVASAAEELAAQIEQSSRGSEEQRSRTTETATAMTQMNSTVLEVAKSAGSAADIADQTKKKAQEGAEQVSQLVSTINGVKDQAEALRGDMTELGKQAEGIGQIMGVISDIADQTNLLALNAAIEAARAGEAGRGFAVVADEVRKLAEKTMSATNEVGGNIHSVQESVRKSIQNTETTTKAIENSTELAHGSGQVLDEIVVLIDSTADHVRGIATASEQQSAASEEINRSTEEINRIATETAEAMDQSGKAVTELARLAGELRNIINDMNSQQAKA